MAKATKAAKAPPAPTAATAVTEAELPPFSIALAQPGEDLPDGARRFPCPNCGAKHDAVRTDERGGQAGTWTVPQFTCVAGCGYAATSFPVT